jgi:uncharacterized membrane-anchored protein
MRSRCSRFLSWWASERTLSIHSIFTARREAFFRAPVVATFALGTAAGDLATVSFKLGYAGSAVLFAAVILIPAVGFRAGWDAVFAFWLAYVITRSLGASLADWLGKPHDATGLGWGAGRVSLALTFVTVVLVAFLAATRRDEQVSGGADLVALQD